MVESGMTALVRRAREAAGWTQERLAAAAGVSSKTIKRLEAGLTVSARSVSEVCTALGLDLRRGGALSARAPQPPYSWLDSIEKGTGNIGARGGVCSVIRVDGTRKPLSESGLSALSDGLATSLMGCLARPGHALQFWFSHEPTPDVDLDGAARRAEELNLDLGDILKERAEALRSACYRERFRIVAWTRPEARVSAPRWRHENGEAPLTFAPVRPLHTNFVSTIQNGLSRLGVSTTTLDGEDAWAEAVGSACPLDEAATPAPLTAFSSPPKDEGGLARCGRALVGALDMEIGPQEIRSFASLAERLRGEGFPWRASFLVEGAQGGLDDVRVRVSFATWGDEVEKVRNALLSLQRLVEMWGYCVLEPSRDPVAGAVSSAMALDVASSARSSIAPLNDILRMLPWASDSSPFAKGELVFRTLEGRPWPYRAGSDVRYTNSDLVYSPPGRGLNRLLASMALAECLAPRVRPKGVLSLMLPRMAIISSGLAASGFVAMLRGALPEGRRNEAVCRILSDEDAINPFDTQLGYRKPTALELCDMINCLMTILGEDGSWSASERNCFVQLSSVAIGALFDRFSDLSKDGTPRLYGAGENVEVDRALERLGILPGRAQTWWGVVDALFEHGAHVEAILAQRHAVPRVGDFVTVLLPEVLNIYGAVRIDNGEAVINAFVRRIMTALTVRPALGRPTDFDMGGDRVTAIEIGGGKWAPLNYMLARSVIMRRDLWAGEPYLSPDICPELYWQHHRERSNSSHWDCPAVFGWGIDQAAKSVSVQRQITVDQREGRKWGVRTLFSAGTLQAFDRDAVELATGLWLLGASTAKEAAAIESMFGLSREAKHALVRDLHGPGPKGLPFLVVMQTKYWCEEHILIDVATPLELWATAGRPEDAELRRRLEDSLGAVETRRRLAVRFPHGTAWPEIERMSEGRGDTERQSAFDRIVDGLITGQSSDEE